jgi:hypothetical protein
MTSPPKHDTAKNADDDNKESEGDVNPDTTDGG